jgi:hypothetical protein
MNAASTLPKDVVNSLRPGDVQLYLSSRGWMSKPYGPDGSGLQLRHPSFPKVDLLLPLKRDLGDFALRMGDFVVALATIERRPAQEVLNDLSGPAGDVFRLSIVGSVAALGNLPIEEAIQLLQGARQLLWSSAFSVIRLRSLEARRRTPGRSIPAGIRP